MNKEELESLVGTGLSIRGLSDSTGLTMSAVRYRLKLYGLKTLNPSTKTSNIAGTLRECVFCNRKFEYLRGKGHRKDACNSCLVLRRKYQTKLRLIERLGGKCSSCGYNKCMGSLQFHHTVGTKSFSIGGNYNRALAELQLEADKCVILCANCHGEHHYDHRIFNQE